MKAKTVVSVLLLVFVAASVAFMISKERKSPEQPIVQEPEAATENCLVVYYFHGDKRCATCMKLEGYAKEALDQYFASQLEDGQIIFKPINTDTPANAHYIKDYQLVAKSVVLSKQENGSELSWVNLDKIWDKVGNKEDYIGYIKESIGQMLAE